MAFEVTRDLPMEEVYPRDKPADYQEVLLRRYGKGRVAYFCGDPDRCYWDYLLPDYRRLLCNCVRWAIRGDDAVRVEGHGLMDVTLWENGEGLMVHLVNMTTPHAMRGPAEELLPVPNVVLSVRSGLAGKGSVASLENSSVSVERSGGYTRVTIPCLKLHEVIIFRRGGDADA